MTQQGIVPGTSRTRRGCFTVKLSGRHVVSGSLWYALVEIDTLFNIMESYDFGPLTQASRYFAVVFFLPANVCVMYLVCSLLNIVPPAFVTLPFVSHLQLSYVEILSGVLPDLMTVTLWQTKIVTMKRGCLFSFQTSTDTTSYRIH